MTAQSSTVPPSTVPSSKPDRCQWPPRAQLHCQRMTPLPKLTNEQRAEALRKAAEARRIRAEIKDRLKMGILMFDELLAEADTIESVGKLKTLAALESMPGLGKVKARRLMTAIGIAENRRLRGLGESQRRRLVEHCSPGSASGK